MNCLHELLTWWIRNLKTFATWSQAVTQSNNRLSFYNLLLKLEHNSIWQWQLQTTGSVENEQVRVIIFWHGMQKRLNVWNVIWTYSIWQRQNTND